MPLDKRNLTIAKVRNSHTIVTAFKVFVAKNEVQWNLWFARHTLSWLNFLCIAEVLFKVKIQSAMASDPLNTQEIFNFVVTHSFEVVWWYNDVSKRF